MNQLSQSEWEASIERVGVVVGCLLKKDNKYLLVQENQSSARGLWNLPAGHVDKNEELKAAAIRETKEETGLEVRLIKQVGLYHERAAKSVKHVYTQKLQVESYDHKKGRLWKQNGLLLMRSLSLMTIIKLEHHGYGILFKRIITPVFKVAKYIR